MKSQPTDTAASLPPARHASLLERRSGQAILTLALPVVGEQFCNILVGLVDTFLAGRISKEAIAAVGLASYVGWLATMLSGLVGIGATALVARAWGAREFERGNKIANQAVGLAGIWGVVMTGGLLALAGVMPAFMGLTGEGHAVAEQYLRYDAAGQFLFAYLLIGAACLRGAGDTRTPMIIMILVNVVNAVVSTTLALGVGPLPALGVTGIVIGTVTARSLGGILMLSVLARGRSGLRLSPLDMRPRPEALRILKIGGPAALDSGVMWIGQFLFLTFLTDVTADPALGVAAYAAHMVAIRVEAFSYLPAMAWGVAAATLVGQALGAGNPTRARRIGHIAVLQLMPFALLIAAVYYLGANFIFTVWSNDPGVRAVGVPALRLSAFFQPFLIAMIVYLSALRGAGDTRFPLLFTMVGVFGIRIPLAYILGVLLKGGLIAAWIGMCIDLTVRCLLAMLRFARGRWAERVI